MLFVKIMILTLQQDITEMMQQDEGETSEITASEMDKVSARLQKQC